MPLYGVHSNRHREQQSIAHVRAALWLQGVDLNNEEVLEYISESSTMSKAMDEYEGEAKVCLSSDQSFQTKLSRVHWQVIHLEQGKKEYAALHWLLKTCGAAVGKVRMESQGGRGRHRAVNYNAPAELLQ